MKKQKGEAGYIQYQKRYRLLVTVLLFLAPLAVFSAGILYKGNRENILTVIAVVLCLPGCKSLVGFIMMMMRKPSDPALLQKIQAHAGKLTMAYELYFTSYEKNAYVDAAAICGNTLVCYAGNCSVSDREFIRDHIEKLIRHNGYPVSVHVLEHLERYLDRLETLNANYDSLHDNLNYRPSETYPDYSRDEMIRHILLTLVL